jgi:hypothetical protein
MAEPWEGEGLRGRGRLNRRDAEKVALLYRLLNPLIPAKAGTQWCPARRSSDGIGAHRQTQKTWVPASAGKSGVGVVRRQGFHSRSKGT